MKRTIEKIVYIEDEGFGIPKKRNLKISEPISIAVFNLIDRLEKAKEMKLKHHLSFEKVFSEAAEIKLKKTEGYGEERYESDDIEMHLWIIYSDVWRKFVRLKSMVKEINKTMNETLLEKFRSDLIDLSNYSLMGVQIIDKIIRKEGK